MFEYEEGDRIKRALQAKAESIQPPASLKRKVFEELELLNKKGEMLAKITIDTLDPADAFDRVIQSLEPGMGKAIYVTAGNPEQKISNQTNYAYEPWSSNLEQLRAHVKPHLFKTPIGAQLRGIFVMYGFDSLTPHEEQEMVTEAGRTGAALVVRDLPKSDRIVGAKLIYTEAGNGAEFELHVLTTTKSRIHVPDLQRHQVERVCVGGQEGLLLSDAAHWQLIWVEEEDGRRVQHEIRAKHVSKAWLMSLAESLAY